MTAENKGLWEYYRWMITEMKGIQKGVKKYPKMKEKPTEKDWDEMRKIKYGTR